jgi:hypothetical protein
LVIISSREGKSADLDKVSQDTKNIRLSPSGVGLQYLDGTEWKQFRNNSYVVLSVTKTPYRGENESSNWFAKYTEAERTAEEKLVGGQPTDKVKPEVIGLWTEGNALLFADPNYLQNERNLIKNKHFKALQDVFLAKGDASKAKLDSNALGVAPNYADLALKYENAAAKQSAQITISAIDLDGNPLQNARISLTDFNSSSNKGVISTTTNDHGEAVFKGVSPGKYKIKGDFGGFVVHGVGYPYNELPDKGVSVETGAFIVDPKDKLHITVHRMLKENGLTSE